MFEAFSPSDLGLAIRGLRNERGWTQERLAAWCGVSRQTIVALEQGGPVSLIVAVKAVTLLGGKIVVAPKNAILSPRAMR